MVQWVMDHHCLFEVIIICKNENHGHIPKLTWERRHLTDFWAQSCASTLILSLPSHPQTGTIMQKICVSLAA